MYILGYDDSRKLVKIGSYDAIATYSDILKDPENIVNVHDGAIVKYKAHFYKEGLVTNFIGKITTSRTTDGIITGLYITPLYIFHSGEWCKFKCKLYNPYRSSFLYPQLLMMSYYCSIYAAHTALDYLDTLENVSISSFTISERVVE
jgi:hypothetical protein